MTGHLLAVDHAAAAKTIVITGGTWIVAILAAAAGAWVRWLAPIGIFVIYVLMHAGGHAVHGTSSDLGWLVVAAVGLFAGLQLGGRTMLRHVGEREYRSRIIAAKTISSLWSRWFRDAL
jgi:hypothetical protein